VESDPLLLQKLGKNIRRERVARKLTQEKLSELSGMDITNLQRIEAGKYNTKILTLIRLKEAMDVDWDQLIPDLK
jgi:transcriptional regulator with XRE-family HTH domain